jgi:hypothetical protein
MRGASATEPLLAPGTILPPPDREAEVKDQLTAALVCAAILFAIDYVLFDGRYAAATMLIVSNVYQRGW